MAAPRLSERFGGYLTSAAIFAAMTALWAVIVRDDAFYGATEIFGTPTPATLVAYLVAMPAVGFILGRWRYDSGPSRSVAGFVSRGLARLLQFAYSHLLLTLFTAAMAAELFFGWRLAGAVRDVDDRLFDLAARYAPWLSAYLAGFNLGRAFRFDREMREAVTTGATSAGFASDDAPERVEPVFFEPSGESDVYAEDPPEPAFAPPPPQFSAEPIPSFQRLR